MKLSRAVGTAGTLPACAGNGSPVATRDHCLHDVRAFRGRSIALVPILGLVRTPVNAPIVAIPAGGMQETPRSEAGWNTAVITSATQAFVKDR